MISMQILYSPRHWQRHLALNCSFTLILIRLSLVASYCKAHNIHKLQSVFSVLCKCSIMGKTSDTDVYVKRPKTSAQVSQTLKGKHTLSLNISIACCTGGELQDLRFSFFSLLPQTSNVYKPHINISSIKMM